ncbi:MAG: hypothetical protein AAGF54_13355 [Pseudomonadota bacterium]
MKNLIKLAGAAAVVLASSQAYAQTASGDVIFNGSILNTCTISNINAGTLEAGTNNTVLSSRTNPANAGSATVSANSNAFDISVAAPTAFTTAPAGAAATFTADFTATGDTTQGTATSGPIDLNTGDTTVTVNMDATSSAGAFPTGAYSATVVLTCE